MDIVVASSHTSGDKMVKHWSHDFAVRPEMSGRGGEEGSSLSRQGGPDLCRSRQDASALRFASAGTPTYHLMMARFALHFATNLLQCNEKRRGSGQRTFDASSSWTRSVLPRICGHIPPSFVADEQTSIACCRAKDTSALEPLRLRVHGMVLPMSDSR